MRLVTIVEKGFAALSIDASLRPLLGGGIVGVLGLISPQVLSSGHGAMHLHLSMHYTLWAVVVVFVLKVLASAVSLGSGFRGGLFFASLFLGALVGSMFTDVMAFVAPETGIHNSVAEVVGMTSLAVGVVGGPLTMTFLALEATRDLTLTGVVLAAAIVSSMLVRVVFGYSFSTWRLHLRGETIRSAHDIGWMRNLTVRGMMRADVPTVDAETSIASFRSLFPLGSTERVVAVNDDNQYAGMIFVPDAFSDRADLNATVQSLIKFEDAVLIPPMNAKAAAETFGKANAEELAVVDSFRTRRVIGLLTEGYLMRRYSDELEKVRRDLSGDV